MITHIVSSLLYEVMSHHALTTHHGFCAVPDVLSDVLFPCFFISIIDSIDELFTSVFYRRLDAMQFDQF